MVFENDLIGNYRQQFTFTSAKIGYDFTFIRYDGQIYFRHNPDSVMGMDFRFIQPLGEISGSTDDSIERTADSMLTSLLSNFKNLVQLPDEKIDGVQCFHYQGDYIYSSEYTTKTEIWIDDSSYLPRRMVIYNEYPWSVNEMKSGNPSAVSKNKMTINGSYSTESVTITPPLTDTGDLLPGWALYTKTE